MNALTTAALVIGSIAMVAGGFTVSVLLLWLAARATGKYAWHTWDNMKSIYKLESMRYWFRRMEDNGAQVLKRATQEGSDKEKSE